MNSFTSQLDTLLEKPDITLEAILDEDNILNELKSSGQTKFAKFVIGKPQVYQKLINYIIEYDPVRRNETTQVKFPFLISELFFAENSQLIDFLFDPIDTTANVQTEPDQTQDQTVNNEALEREQIRQTLFPQLLSFLQQDTLHVTSAGYFNKTFIPIIKKRPIDVWDAIQKFDVGHLVKHLDTHHVADIVEKLILIDTSNLSGEETKFTERRELLSRMINYMMNKSHNPGIVDNVAYVLNEIVNRAALNPQHKEWQIFVQIINKPDEIFTLAAQVRSAALFQLLINLVTYKQKRRQTTSEPNDEEVINYNYEGELTDLEFYNLFLPVCHKFSKFLSSTPLIGDQFWTTYGEHVEPLSAAKLTAIQLLIQLLLLNYDNISLRIAEDETFLTISRLLEKHQFNNQMLILFERMVVTIFNNDVHYELQKQVLSFLQYLIVNNTNQSKFYGQLSSKIKPGYQGVLTKISNFLESKASINPELKEALSSPEWTAYSAECLREINEVERKFLCDVNPRAKPPPMEDEWAEQDVERILDKFKYTRKNEKEESKGKNDDNNGQDDDQDDVEIEEQKNDQDGEPDAEQNEGNHEADDGQDDEDVKENNNVHKDEEQVHEKNEEPAPEEQKEETQQKESSPVKDEHQHIQNEEPQQEEQNKPEQKAEENVVVQEDQQVQQEQVIEQPKVEENNEEPVQAEIVEAPKQDEQVEEAKQEEKVESQQEQKAEDSQQEQQVEDSKAGVELSEEPKSVDQPEQQKAEETIVQADNEPKQEEQPEVVPQQE